MHGVDLNDVYFHCFVGAYEQNLNNVINTLLFMLRYNDLSLM